MKGTAFAGVFTACFLIAVSPARAQDCSDWSNWDLRGTYTMNGSGWIDPSTLAPALPKGTVPLKWVGAAVFDGSGSATAWVLANGGGVQLTMRSKNITYQMRSDCSLTLTAVWTVDELGGMSIGPFVRVLVVGPRQPAFEAYGIMAGAAAPGGPVEGFTARRISMKNY